MCQRLIKERGIETTAIATSAIVATIADIWKNTWDESIDKWGSSNYIRSINWIENIEVLQFSSASLTKLAFRNDGWYF